MPLNKPIEDWGMLVFGLVCFIYGFFGRNLRNEVEMPMTEEQRANQTAPTLFARILYIVFAGAMFLWALSDLRR